MTLILILLVLIVLLDIGIFFVALDILRILERDRRKVRMQLTFGSPTRK